jgi:hypothetical protein
VKQHGRHKPARWHGNGNRTERKEQTHMVEQMGKIVIHYPEATPILDPATGETTEGQQLVVVLKAEGDDKEYTHQLPITQDLPATAQLDQWQQNGDLVVISASSVRANTFQHQEKDETGQPKKYPQPGKVYKVAGKAIEIGTILSFQSYAIRQATAEDADRAKVAHGRYMQRQQQARMRSIQGRQEKAKARTQKTIAERKQQKKAS